jgi:hypothetical protein
MESSSQAPISAQQTGQQDALDNEGICPLIVVMNLMLISDGVNTLKRKRRHSDPYRQSPELKRLNTSKQSLLPSSDAVPSGIQSKPIEVDAHQPATTETRKRHREEPPQDLVDDHAAKRLRSSSCPAHFTSDENHSNKEPIDPIKYWSETGHWPKEYADAVMERVLARKKSSSTLSRKRSNSTTPSDRPGEEKSAPYRDPRYKTLLATKGSFMDKSELDIADESKKLCRTLLETAQKLPKDSLFRDDIFDTTCQRVEDRNEARVLRDINPLIVPSAEVLATYGAKHLDCLIESTNEGWNNSIPLTTTRPQPDYSVGFKREAFTDEQLMSLSPFIGDFISGDQSFFMGTYYMYFPFLTCEVKCGAAALDTADRQNAHSNTLAARAIVELFRLVKREKALNRQILAFSVSHDHCSVRIYGCYPVISGKDTRYYRHPIHKFDFTALDGKDKWLAYTFTKNLYDIWMPAHLERIRSAVDALPSHLDFDVPGLEETGLSQGLESHHLSHSEDSTAGLKDDDKDSADQHGDTPGTSFTGPGVSKKQKK